MASNNGSDGREHEIASYQRAAEETLDQLDWCINYLHRIRKSAIANALAKNGATIRRQMSGADH
jgi:hypothetical protein